jgi:hypothetical protein
MRRPSAPGTHHHYLTVTAWCRKELGHVMLHGPESTVSRDIGEVEAESVAFVLGARFGLDTSDYSLDYIAGWATADPKAVETTASRVVKASQSAMKAFDDAARRRRRDCG